MRGGKASSGAISACLTRLWLFKKGLKDLAISLAGGEVVTACPRVLYAPGRLVRRIDGRAINSWSISDKRSIKY